MYKGIACMHGVACPVYMVITTHNLFELHIHCHWWVRSDIIEAMSVLWRCIDASLSIWRHVYSGKYLPDL